MLVVLPVLVSALFFPCIIPACYSAWALYFSFEIVMITCDLKGGSRASSADRVPPWGVSL